MKNSIPFDRRLYFQVFAFAIALSLGSSLNFVLAKAEGPLEAQSEMALKLAVQSSAEVLLPESYKDITPKRFKVAAYLDCGSERKTRNTGISIERISGKSGNTKPGAHPALSLDFSKKALDYAISGLDPSVDYIIGFSWWDEGFKGRQQSIHINGEEVLPAARPIAYEEFPESRDPERTFVGKPTPARIQFALMPEHIKSGRVDISIRKVAGPNAVNSELWIMERDQPAGQKQVLLLSGQDYPGHHWRKTGPVMEQLITEDSRIEVTICETPYALGLKHINAYDAVVIHFKNYEDTLPSTPAMRKNIDRYVRNGGGMCLSHFACGALEEWPEFVNISGRIWSHEGHDKRGPFIVNVIDKEHPVSRGISDFETDDELYFCLTGEPEVHTLCEAFSVTKQAKHPQALVFEPGTGRVFLSTLGHDTKAYDAASVRKLYRQGTAWASGLE